MIRKKCREGGEEVRSGVAEGAVRHTESREDAIDSDAKPLISEFLGGHRAELCVFTGEECNECEMVSGQQEMQQR